MKIFHGFEELHIEEDTHVTLGKFDGVHLGHIALLSHLPQPKAVFTFDISESSGIILTAAERERRFAELGVQYLFVCPFTKELMGMEPEIFLERLIHAMHIKTLAVGTDFRFGRNRGGDAALLKVLAPRFGVTLHVQEKLWFEDAEISSTRIRTEISQGRMDALPQMLGTPYYIEGEVVHGRALGRDHAVPTINVEPGWGKLLPPCGVYASDVKLSDGRVIPGISNLGRKPTVTDGVIEPVSVETNLFDFSEDLYGENVTIYLKRFLRPEQRFESMEALYAQIEKDIAQAKT